MKIVRIDPERSPGPWWAIQKLQKPSETLENIFNEPEKTKLGVINLDLDENCYKFIAPIPHSFLSGSETSETTGDPQEIRHKNENYVQDRFLHRGIMCPGGCISFGFALQACANQYASFGLSIKMVYIGVVPFVFCYKTIVFRCISFGCSMNMM